MDFITFQHQSGQIRQQNEKKGLCLIVLWFEIILDSTISGVYYYVYNRLIGLVGRVFANGPGDLGSIPGRVIPNTLKMVLGTSLLNAQQYKIRIKSKVGQSRERTSTFPYTSV